MNTSVATYLTHLVGMEKVVMCLASGCPLFSVLMFGASSVAAANKHCLSTRSLSLLAVVLPFSLQCSSACSYYYLLTTLFLFVVIVSLSCASPSLTQASLFMGLC